MTDIFDDIGEDMAEQQAKTITVEDFDTFMAEYDKQRLKLEDLKQATKDQQEVVSRLDYKVMEYLEALGRKSYDSPSGKIHIQTRYSVALPQGEDKKAFFEYLRSKGEDFFESIVHINSRTLQSFVKEEMKENEDVAGWTVPGCRNSQTKKIVTFKRSS